MSEPQQQPTPDKTPKKSAKKPTPTQDDAEMSSAADNEDDPGYESRSRSQSRRRRRQSQRQRGASSKAEAGNAKASSQAMTKVPEQPELEAQQEEEDLEPEEVIPSRRQPQNENRPQNTHPDWPYMPRDQWLDNPATQDTTEEQPFERIKPPSQSMSGPVTYARMMRGEIPWRGAPPRQPYDTTQGVDAKVDGATGKDPMEQDGLKLRIELNLDIEIELKASIHGDITLALMTGT